MDEITKSLKKLDADLNPEFRGQTSFMVMPEKIVAVCETLKNDHGFTFLASLTAVDYFPAQTPRFHAVYQLSNYEANTRVELRVPLNGNAPELESISEVFPNANWHERELYDMFGIQMLNHPDLRRILMPYDWEGHPLRKDYPLGYEEVQFTFNREEIQARKPNPKN